MVNPMVVAIKARKLGVLLRDARQARGRNMIECAQAIGASTQTYEAYEYGQQSPSLPELELLAYYLDVPLEHFLQQATLLGEGQQNRVEQISELLQLRQRAIGALMRKTRLEAGMTLEAIADKTGIPSEEMNDYELGERPIDLPRLQLISAALERSIQEFKDKRGPVGRWMAQQQAQKEFTSLPADLQIFVSNPESRPFLEVAQRLSQLSLNQLSLNQLRIVADTLQTITRE
jgi:transcriptional regulator with XRE-family HTH domain